jgi:hypothetical protein
LPVRLLGIGVSGIDRAEAAQGTLFDDPSRLKESELDVAADRIRERFGETALRRGAHLEHRARHTPQPRPDDA